jgi:hypothetical protein
MNPDTPERFREEIVNQLHLWAPPPDQDRKCVDLCTAMNKIPGIRANGCSCDNDDGCVILFEPKTMKSLLPLLYWIEWCHSGLSGWRVIVYTDCGRSRQLFRLEGPAGEQAYQDAKYIANLIRQEFP